MEGETTGEEGSGGFGEVRELGDQAGAAEGLLDAGWGHDQPAKGEGEKRERTMILEKKLRWIHFVNLGLSRP